MRVRPDERGPVTADELHAMYVRLGETHSAGATPDYYVRPRSPADKRKSHLRSLIEAHRVQAQLAIATMEQLIRAYHGLRLEEEPRPEEGGRMIDDHEVDLQHEG